MHVDEFWSLIAEAKARASGQAEEYPGDAIAAELARRLATAGPQTILEFHDQYSRATGALYRWDVWAAAYLICGGCSDDSFIDFRAGAVSLGRDWFERTRENPDALAGHPVVRQAASSDEHDYPLLTESVNYVADTAFEQLTGDDQAFYNAWEEYQRTVLADRADENDDMGEEFDFDDDAEMRRRLPQLSALFRPQDRPDTRPT